MTPSVLSPTFVFKSSVDSTNLIAKEHARKGAASGLVIVSSTQTHGRGSGGRKWHSPKGGLYMSILLPLAEGVPPTCIPILAALAVSEALARITHIPLKVKWPNDCLIGKKKVAGILCEVVVETAQVVVGIGVNVNTEANDLAPFQKNIFSATSLHLETGKRWQIHELLVEIVQELFTGHQKLSEMGFLHVQRHWERLCPFIGKQVKVKWADRVEDVFFLGIDETGQAVVSSGAGERQTIASGEVLWF